ncbi:unnamed protein product [Spirodela intermedia]|uniref:Uncharacterized protein n=1 Tax=Spirodela intermedia TaxID=51605 RepID=A0A7I8KJ42_SPIIN|nr:unnamed protein product [Spirodela intermedia]
MNFRCVKLTQSPTLVHPGVCDTADDALLSIGTKARPVSNATEEQTYDISCIIKGKMAQALRCFKESTDQHVLVQVWAPVKNGGRQVLTTSEQPFVLDPHIISLLQYRTVSLAYLFSVDGHSDGDLGLPGRVFSRQLPEWTPDVQYYSSKEYPRLTHALNYNVKGSLALPVFEHSYQRCVGVVELIMTSQKINYADEVDKVCKALEAVNLKSSEMLGHPSVQIFNEGHQAAMSEILEVLTIVCEMHKLPLAQTWVPCRHGRCLTHDGDKNTIVLGQDEPYPEQLCMSTTDAAFYIVEPHMWGFRDACAEHRLQKGQGLAGMAYSLRRPCFSSDITRFGKNSYPLVHYARMFGLAGCLALCLQSCHTGNDDYVLEFFLPRECRSGMEQLTLLETISTAIRQLFRSLKVVFKTETGGEIFDEILHVDGDSENAAVHNQTPKACEGSSVEIKAPQAPPSSENNTKIAQKSNHKKGRALAMEQSQNPTFTEAHERRRGKAEKTISLEILKRYFAGSLKDAAKSLGVCPTTMKRICRQHGISRWPSRKIKKVNRSLSKLKTVIESVQGAGGAFDLPDAAGVWSQQLYKPQPNKSPGNGNPDDLVGIHRGNEPLGIENNTTAEASSQQGQPGEVNSPPDLIKGQPGEGTEARPPSQGSCPGSPANKKSDREAPPSPPNAGHGVNPMLVEDSGSSKDLKSLCLSFGGGCPDALILSTSTVKVKASYRGDIIRFRVKSGVGVFLLKEQVAKRLKLDLGAFDLKYLDDDGEWVLLACDADLEECLEVNGGQVVRLSVTDVASNPGSFSESSGG